MTKEEEAKFDKWADDHFKSQRELPKGRHFLWDTFRFRSMSDIKQYRRNMDRVFPDAPGAGL